MKIIFDSRCLEYSSPGHPESPQRVKLAYDYLKDKNYEFILPRDFSEELILNVHTWEHITRVKKGNFYDPDTPRIEGIYSYAKLAVEGAITAYEVAMNDGVAFSLMRPPGHHAGKNFLGGFCYLNNIAVAGAKALNEGKRVAILDIDAHHGNGTQDIFMGRENVIYISLHQVPLYPGTGLHSQITCYNFPLPPETRNEEYLNAWEEALQIISEFNPDVVALSLGLDTYCEDLLTNFQLTFEVYEKIGEGLKKFRPLFAVLEGGYTSHLGSLIDAIFKN